MKGTFLDLGRRGGMKRGECVRCGKITEVHSHHVKRRMNDRHEVVRLCMECHRWVHEHPAEAEIEGLYLPMDGAYHRRNRGNHILN